MKEIKKKIKDSIFGDFNQELIGDKVTLQNQVNKLQRMIDMINYLQPIEEKEFVLPKKWCVFRNEENDKIINDWFSKEDNNKHGFYFIGSNSFLCSSQINYNDWIPMERQTPEYGYTEITFEQFKKYVLNK